MFKFEITKDGAGFYRWTLVSASHRTVATSAERFTSMESCWRSAQQVKSSIYGAPIEDLSLAGARSS